MILTNAVRARNIELQMARHMAWKACCDAFRRFGSELPPDKALSDDERYILDNAADIIQDQGPK